MDMSFFAEMAWKSALIAGAALALAQVLRSRAAADRALVLRLGVAMLLLLPLIAVLLPELRIVAFAAPEAGATVTLTEAQLAALMAAAPAPEPTIWDDPTPLVILAYLGGLAMVGSRLLAGLWLLARWTRGAEEVTCPEWLAAFDRVRWVVPDAESVRLMVSGDVQSPMSWGWRRPVILIDPDTLDQPEDAEAILAHEAAHIARRDWPVLMLTRIAATLFWFNPLVWALEREVVQQAEEAADCAAAERVEPARYAETLLNWAQANAMVPANSIAPSTRALGRRIKAILDRRMRERPSGSAWTAFAMIACIAIATPVAAMQLVAADPPPAPAAPSAPAAAAAPPAPAAPMAPAAPAVEDIVISVPAVPEIPPIADDVLGEVLPRIPGIVATATAAVHPHEIEEAMREAQRELRRSGRLTREQRRQIDRAMRDARRAQSRVRVVVPHAEIERAVREGQRARTVVIPREQIEVAMREARRAAAIAPRAVAVSMAHSADGMLRGADGMEQGARQMEETAERLQDRDYREREIERARRRGETVTHEQLLEAAEGMREGAEGMREGAREMREAAQRMRAHRE